MRARYQDLPPEEQDQLKERARVSFHAAGHSFAPTCPPDTIDRHLRRNAQWAWERDHQTRLERWSRGWYGMTWDDHVSMFRNNYLGHRNAQLYFNGPKLYIPARHGLLSKPWAVRLLGLGQQPVVFRRIGDLVNRD